MNLTTAQLVLVFAVLAFALYVFRMRSILTDRLIYLLLACGGMLLVIRPGLATALANLIGIGRGTDLLLYGLIIFTLFQRVGLVSETKKTERQITAVVRALAISGAVQGPQTEPAIAAQGEDATPPLARADGEAGAAGGPGR